MAEVNSSNFSDKLQEAHDFIAQNNWEQFDTLWSAINDFLAKNNGTETDSKFQATKDEAYEAIKALIEKVDTYELLHKYFKTLSIIINDSQTLWTTLHSKLNGVLKITFHEAQEIAAAFFNPHELFEYGFSSFHKSSLCNMNNITNEEALIDIFYAIAGFIRACQLEDNYETNNSEYEQFISQLLTLFTQLQDFDAHRFVWLVEAINQHLHLPQSVFKDICEKVIHEYLTNNFDPNLKTRLLKLCTITTSPFLQSLTSIREAIDSTFLSVIKDQRFFIRKYIFSGYSSVNWTGSATKSLSDPLRAWRLYLVNLVSKIQEDPEFPNLLLIDFLDDSLLVFNQIYGDIQPSKGRASDLRLDIFGIVDIIAHNYPVEMTSQVLKRIWYLLFVAAIVGAADSDFENLKYQLGRETETPYLGLDRSGADFLNYRLALQTYGKKFESEIQDMDAMFKFLRTNIKNEE